MDLDNVEEMFVVFAEIWHIVRETLVAAFLMRLSRAWSINWLLFGRSCNLTNYRSRMQWMSLSDFLGSGGLAGCYFWTPSDKHQLRRLEFCYEVGARTTTEGYMIVQRMNSKCQVTIIRCMNSCWSMDHMYQVLRCYSCAVPDHLCFSIFWAQQVDQLLIFLTSPVSMTQHTVQLMCTMKTLAHATLSSLWVYDRDTHSHSVQLTCAQWRLKHTQLMRVLSATHTLSTLCSISME